MNRRTKIAGALRWSPLALAVTLACSPIAAMAQDDAVEMERIQVTGSRIKKSESERVAPVLTLDRSYLDRTGLSSVGDVINQLTVSGKALNTKFNSSGNFGYPADGGGIGAGSAQIDLRSLGAQRVLVLVDGRRWVNETSASGVGGAVDLNTIPLAIVERIEVLNDGASAIYGSDAISGVVNVITRKSFDGAMISAQYGDYTLDGGGTTDAQATIGGSGERFSGMVTAAYVRQNSISSAEFDNAQFPVPNTGVTRGSSATPQGRFIFSDPRSGLDNNITLNNGTGTPVFVPGSPTTPPSTYHPFTLDDRFNFAPYNLLLTPSERKSLWADTRYQLTDSITWYMRGMYNNRQSTNQAAPEPIFIGSDAGAGSLADSISISRDNPYNPFGIDLVSGENFFLLGRRPVEFGPRIFNQDVDTYYFNTGLEGSFSWGDRAMSWDANYMYSDSQADQQFFNTWNLRRMQIALGPPEICAANPGCVPLNLFGGQGANGQGTITQEMTDWATQTIQDSSEQSLESFSANLTGDLFEMPAGSLAFATGYEWREYQGSFTPDQSRVVGESQDSTAIPTSGEYDVSEFYAEVNVPLLANVAGAQSLELSLAGRYSDYSTFGGESTFKGGLRWQPFEDLILRGTYGQGFRAPFIGELYGLAQFAGTLTDPCSNQVTGNSQLAQNCRALGVPDGYEQINTQILSTTGGNPLLEPENSDNYTAGIVYSPEWGTNQSWASRVDFEATYWNYKIEDAIQAVDAQDQLDACVDSGDPDSVFCQGITRTSTGQISSFDNRLQNIGEINTDGWDFGFNWSSVEYSFGSFSFSLVSTYTNDYEATDQLGNTFTRTVGVEVNDSAIPEWKTRAQTTWSFGDWTVGWTLRYLSSVTESCSDFRDNTSLSLTALGLCTNPDLDDNANSTHRLGSTAYNDFQVTWNQPFATENLSLSAGVNNAFDKDPPTCYTCSLNGYDAGTYDLPSPFWYVQAQYKF